MNQRTLSWVGKQSAVQEMSLAELSRQHLSGAISTREYLERERQLLPRSGMFSVGMGGQNVAKRV